MPRKKATAKKPYKYAPANEHCEKIVGFRLVADIGDEISGDDVLDSPAVFYSTCEPDLLKKVFLNVPDQLKG